MRSITFGVAVWLSVLLAACGATAPAAPDQPNAAINAQDYATLSTALTTLSTAIKSNNVQDAREAFKAFDENGWNKVEDNVKKNSPDAYKAIEDAMNGLQDALVRTDKPDMNAVNQAFSALQNTVAKYAGGR